MQDRIAALDDPTATALVNALAAPHLRNDDRQAELTPDLCQALSDTFGGAISVETASEGDLARQTLLFLAQDASLHPVLTAFLDGPEAEHFGKPAPNRAAGGKAISITIAVLLLLQTHLHFERDASGKWNVLIDKPATSEEILKPIVQRLLAVPPSPARLPK